MQIWTASGREKKNHYAALSIFGILGIVVLAMGLGVAFSLLALIFEWTKWTGLLICVGETALAVWAAFRLGRRSRKDSLLFCLDDNGRLFAVDVSQLVPVHRGLLGYGQMAREIQKEIERLKRQMTEQREAPARGEQILSVERLKEKESGCRLVCQVRNLEGREYRRRWFVARGYENEAELLWQLQRRRSGRSSLQF